MSSRSILRGGVAAITMVHGTPGQSEFFGSQPGFLYSGHVVTLPLGQGESEDTPRKLLLDISSYLAQTVGQTVWLTYGGRNMVLSPSPRSRALSTGA
jgi:hypothetical protein